jgi:hypothetical protein
MTPNMFYITGIVFCDQSSMTTKIEFLEMSVIKQLDMIE